MDSSENLRITTYNVEWFFQNDPGFDDLKIMPLEEKSNRVADILSKLGSWPHILALQEVENQAVLDKLVEVIKNKYKVSYVAYCGKFTSKRTAQKPGLLVQVHKDLTINEWDSFHVSHSFSTVQPFLQPEIEIDASLDYFLKNIWLSFTFQNQQFLILNFHLKASFDAISTAVREKEAILVEGLIASFKSKNPNVKCIVLGDFNDYDLTFKNFPPPSVHSDVLKKIREGTDLNETTPKINFYNCLSKAHQKEKHTTIYKIMIDHILIDFDEESIVQCQVLPEKGLDSERTSDHWPVTIDIKL